MNQYLVLAVVALVLYYIFYYRGDGEPTQHDIQTMANVTDEKGQSVGKSSVFSKFKDLAYPQISHGFTQLSKGNVQPLKDAVSSVPSSFTRVRHVDQSQKQQPQTMSPKRMYLPDYYRKDTMDPNDIGSSEMRGFVNDDETKPDDAWTDDNVSEHPKFYNSNQTPENLTNIGAFFDKDNQFNDTTSDNTFALPSDNCYIDRQGKEFCMDNTRMQVVPPELITNPQDDYYLNPEGMYKDYNRIPVDPNRVMNGGDFFEDVFASKPLGHNEGPGKPIPAQFGSCSA
jgi:hypothetical protein